MIEMFTARTSAIDEVEDAINEIKSQIDFAKLKKNSAGIIFTHIDFVDSGAVEALSQALPFDVIGMTSMAGADNHGYGMFDLTLTVLTSDDVKFYVGMTENINHDNYEKQIDDLFNTMRAKSGVDPSLIINFMPYIKDVSGYEEVAAIDKSCHGIPLWGSITSSYDFKYSIVMTICNGKSLPAGVAMMFLCGDIDPKFIVTSIPERNIANNRAAVTKSEGPILYEVNDMPILEYFKKIGLIVNSDNITTTPLIVYYKGSDEPVTLGMYTLFDNGSALTGGEIPVGASIAVGSIDAEGIIESAESGIDQIKCVSNPEATLVLPCVTRYVMLSPWQERELKLITQQLGATNSPFMMGYSGGEICPVPDKDGKMKNRFHNYTFCALVL